MEAIYKFETEKYRLEIEEVPYPMNPRADCDSLSKMICFTKRYDLGDSNADYKSSNYNSFQELKRDIIKREKPVVILPIYMYDHSGIAIDVNPFSCPWDSGQIGYIFMNGYIARENWNKKRISPKLKEKIKNLLIAEIEEYNTFLVEGEFAYTITNLETGEEIDSCGGYYGSNFLENGMAESIDLEIFEAFQPQLEAEFGIKS